MGLIGKIEGFFSSAYNTVKHDVNSAGNSMYIGLKNLEKKVQKGESQVTAKLEDTVDKAMQTGSKAVHYVASKADAVINRVGSFGDKTLGALEGIESGLSQGVQGAGSALQGIGNFAPYLVLVLGGLFLATGGVQSVASAATARYQLPR